jgi:hypothetical protein
MKKIIRNIATAPLTLTKKVSEGLSKVKKDMHKTIVVPFLPSYEVAFTMYNVVPGRPVDTNHQVFKFEKGAELEAHEFYNKLISSTQGYKIMPSEISMKKRKKVVKTVAFGPVQDIKSLMAS